MTPQRMRTRPGPGSGVMEPRIMSGPIRRSGAGVAEKNTWAPTGAASPRTEAVRTSPGHQRIATADDTLARIMRERAETVGAPAVPRIHLSLRLDRARLRAFETRGRGGVAAMLATTRVAEFIVKSRWEDCPPAAIDA